ncbi:MAG: hypothetical protein E8D46_18145 [Nitrospira sp.]|nr:MAG: hypothetical protein E8D46_18145 [Nitrospira sp.]
MVTGAKFLELATLSVGIIYAGMAIVAGAPSSSDASGTATPPQGMAQIQQMPTQAAIETTTLLVSGAEIFENLTETSSVMDAAAFKASLAEFEMLYPEIAARLSADHKKRVDSLVTGIRNAWRQGDRGAMAIRSIEVYRLFQESIDHRNRPVPVEVPLLDYAGFKLKALLLATHPDWKQIAHTTQEALTWWDAIESQITDKVLREAMAQTIAGIKNASARKDSKLLRFAVELDLILVDGLEMFFSSHQPAR